MPGRRGDRHRLIRWLWTSRRLDARLARAGLLPLAALCVLCAHVGGSILWVFSTVLLQLEVPDEFRGRVFAVELALLTLTASLSSYCTGFALDRMGWSPRLLSFTLGVSFFAPGLLWMLLPPRWRGPAEQSFSATGPPTEERILEERIS